MAYRQRPRSLSNSLPVDSRELIDLVIRADDSGPYSIPAWLKEQQHQVARRAKNLYIELDAASCSPRQFLLGNSFKALQKLVISRAYNGDDPDDADTPVELDFDLVEAGSSLRTLVVEGIELSGGNKDPIHIEMLSLSCAAIEWGLLAPLLHGSMEFQVLKLHHSRIANTPHRWRLTLPWLRTLSIYTTRLEDLNMFLNNIETINLQNLDLQVQSVSPKDLQCLYKSVAPRLLLDDAAISLKIGGHIAFIIQILKIIVFHDKGDILHNVKELEIDSEQRWPSDEIWRVHFEDARDLIRRLELGGRISQLECSVY